MKNNQKGTRRRRQTLRLWSHAQAQAALPYFASVMRSVREHQLEAQRQHLAATRLAQRPGRPDRATLIAQEEASRAADRAKERFQEALIELHRLDVYCIDPIAGQALIPFVHDNQLAWFVYDLFDDKPLDSWRYHTDPLEKRRPVSALPKEEAEDRSWVA
jgi:hypothetical protein